MSTVDPRVARAEREQRAQGSPGQALLATLYSLLALAAGSSAAYGFICVMDGFRLMSINGIFDSWDSPLKMTWPFFLFPGIFGLIIFRSLANRAAMRFGGGYGKFLRAFPFSSFGVLVVTACAPFLMTAPSTVGVNEDPTFNNPEAWGLVSWIWYWAPYVAPVLVFIWVIIMLISGIRGIRKGNRATNLVQFGTRTTGRVIEVTGGNTEINGMPLITLSVQFTDTMGTVRYVTKRKPIPAGQIPVVDQPVLVIYDPTNPTDEKNIMLGLGAADAIGNMVSSPSPQF